MTRVLLVVLGVFVWEAVLIFQVGGYTIPDTRACVRSPLVSGSAKWLSVRRRAGLDVRLNISAWRIEKQLQAPKGLLFSREVSSGLDYTLCDAIGRDITKTFGAT